VFEVFPEPVHAVVTIETGVAVREGMREGEGRVHLAVASPARVGGEGGDIPMMTIVAGERFARRRKLVAL